jgi:hypothetical protein
MTRPWIIPLLTAAAAAALAYGLVRHSTCARTTPPGDPLQDISFLTRELKLTDAQAHEVHGLHQSLTSRLNDCCARHCTARARLAQALTDTNSTAQLDAVLKDMCREYELGERATLDHIRAVRAVLNPEQRQQFDSMISRCMCQPCNSEGGSCKMEEGRAPHHTAK